MKGCGRHFWCSALRKCVIATAVLLPALCGAGCSVGSSATHAVDISRADKQAIRVPTAEERVLAEVNGQPLRDWQPGKRFYATDNRALLIFDQRDLPADPDAVGLGGKELIFKGIERTRRPDGSDEAVVVFEADSRRLAFPTGRTPEDALNLLSTDMPMLVDLDVLEQIRGHLVGRELWTRGALWYSTTQPDHRVEGRKFERVRIQSVAPGDAAYPLVVEFTDETGERAAVKMSFGRSAAQSRPFAAVFAVSDPHLQYPDIEDSTWQLIRRGKVRTGMTKDQCRLSIGAPSNVTSGHDYSRTLDLWEYADGQYLMFEDGLLTRYRM